MKRREAFLMFSKNPRLKLNVVRNGWGIGVHVAGYLEGEAEPRMDSFYSEKSMARSVGFMLAMMFGYWDA